MFHSQTANANRIGRSRAGASAFDLYSTIESMPVAASGLRERSILAFMVDATWLSDIESDRILFNAREIADSAKRLLPNTQRASDAQTLNDLIAALDLQGSSN